MWEGRHWSEVQGRTEAREQLSWVAWSHLHPYTPCMNLTVLIHLFSQYPKIRYVEGALQSNTAGAIKIAVKEYQSPAGRQTLEPGFVGSLFHWSQRGTTMASYSRPNNKIFHSETSICSVDEQIPSTQTRARSEMYNRHKYREYCDH